MKRIQKLKNFIWNDLPLRLSTNLIATIGVIMFYSEIVAIRKDIEISSNFLWEQYLPEFFFCYCFIFLPAIGICMILFLIECIFKKLSLNFLFFKLSFYKCIVLIFYAIAIFPIFPTFFPYLFGLD